MNMEKGEEMCERKEKCEREKMSEGRVTCGMEEKCEGEEKREGRGTCGTEEKCEGEGKCGGEEWVCDLLMAHGVRPTANRIVVTRVLNGARRPLSMRELEDEIETMDKSAVFRTLMLFKEHRLVHVISDGSNSERYELCRSHDHAHDDDAHLHFYCERCHRTFCIDEVAVPEVKLPKGYVMSSAMFVARGVCPECGK